MPLNRRNFIAGVGAIAGVGMMTPQLSKTSLAAAPVAKGQVPGVYRTKVGAVQVTSIFDGGMEMGAGIVLEPEMSEINRLKKKAFIQSDHIPGYLNTFVVNTGGKLVLIDTGAADYGPGTGHLLENL
ncbi:MAG: MBL fold metallo-hydrolase, partial [Micavibrio aeruginosavorus]